MASVGRIKRAQRVVVTGVGLVSPAGRSAAELWLSLISSRSGITRRLAPASTSFPFAGAVSGFRLEADCGRLESEAAKALRKAAKLMSRETQMAVAAGQQAWADSGLQGCVDPERVGVCLGAENVAPMPEDFLAGVRACTVGGSAFDAAAWGELGMPEVAPLWLLKCLPNMSACYLAMFNGWQGPNNSITAGAVSGNLALAEACRQIEEGEADAMLVGGIGSRLSPLGLVHAWAEEEISSGHDDPATVCRPFDRGRTGAVPGEGAAAFLLEDSESARRRGAVIYGEIVGTASTCVSDIAGRACCRDASVECLRRCLDDAGWEPDTVGHLHAHGLSARQTDAEEAQAVREVFGPAADRLPVVAAKSCLGDAGAGAGALELAASLLALREGHLFPVQNYEEPDPDCPLRPVTTRGAAAGRSFLNLSLAVDGRASCVAVRAWEWN